MLKLKFELKLSLSQNGFLFDSLIELGWLEPKLEICQWMQFGFYKPISFEKILLFFFRILFFSVQDNLIVLSCMKQWIELVEHIAFIIDL